MQFKNLLADDNRYLHSELSRKLGDDIVGADFGLQGVMTLVRQVAAINSPVLLLGETGVGKDVIANAIHQLSPRRKKPFIAVNCGSIPENLIDSELFGHEKGRIPLGLVPGDRKVWPRIFLGLRYAGRRKFRHDQSDQ